MKTLRTLIASVLIGISLIPQSFVFAQTSGSCACGVTPQVIETYYQFTQKAIGIVGSSYNQSTISPGAPFGGQFSSKNITLKNANTLSTIYKNNQKRLQETISFIGNTARVLGKTARNTAKAFTIELRKGTLNKDIKRDIDKLSTLDPMIDNITLALGRAGQTNKPLSDHHRKQLEKLFQSLQPQLFDGYNISSATYGNIIYLLNSLQSKFKNNILLPDKTDKPKPQEITTGNGTRISISSTTRKAITDSYQCIREQKCNQDVKNVRKAFGKERKQGIKNGAKAINEFVFGRKKLKKFFGFKIGNLTSEEEKRINAHIKEIEQSYGGHKSTDDKKLKLINRKFRSNIVDDIKNLVKTKKLKQIAKPPTPPEYVVRETPTNTQRKKSIQTINNIISQDNKLLTIQFPQDQTQTITNTIKTLKQTKKIIKEINENLSTTCTLQCKNKGGTCRAP